jgi:hypothetical protein
VALNESKSFFFMSQNSFYMLQKLKAIVIKEMKIIKNGEIFYSS